MLSHITPEQRAKKRAYDKIYKAKNKTKILAQATAYRAANPEKVKVAVQLAWSRFGDKYKAAVRASGRYKTPHYIAMAAQWAIGNPDKVRATKRRWVRNHKQQSDEISRRWKAANPEKCKVHKHRRRSRILGCQDHHTEQEWLIILRSHGRKCAYCRTSGTKKNPITRDHIVPISKGGTNSARNLVPACKSCNSKKHDRDPIVFAREELGLLL